MLLSHLAKHQSQYVQAAQKAAKSGYCARSSYAVGASFSSKIPMSARNMRASSATCAEDVEEGIGRKKRRFKVGDKLSENETEAKCF